MKILLLKNNLRHGEGEVVDQALVKTTELLNTIGFKHSWNVFETTTHYTTLPLLPMPGEFQISPQEIFLEEKKFGDYDVVCLVYNPELLVNPPIRPTENAEFIQIPTTWYNGHIQVLVDFILHEMCHERFWATGTPDITHNFYTSEFTQFSDGWTRYYLSLLAKMRPNATVLAPKIPTVYLYRRNASDSNQQLGDLETEGFKCKTLELPYKNNRPNISSIPPGEYFCEYTYSFKFMKRTYEVKNVKGRTGIRIHSGNFFYNIQGCILLGDKYGDVNKDKSADILNSTITVKAFEKHMLYKPYKLIVV